MIKTLNWLVSGNKYETYLFTKEMKKRKKGNITDMRLGNTSMSEIYLFQFSKKYFLWFKLN